MDQAPIIVFLHLKGLSVKDVHIELVQAPGLNAITYSIVAK
jgi:hypothetical protein